MITLQQAQTLIHSFSAPQPATEKVRSENAPGRVLAESPASDLDLPPFDRVTMDGYAVMAADLPGPGRLRCVGEVAAGSTASRPLGPGEAYRIMTGAPLPEGADAVVKVEETREEGDWVVFEQGVRHRQNIHPFGGDLRKGEQPLAIGTRLTPAAVPLLLTMGRSAVEVYRKPTVSILTSGDELVGADEVPGPGQIRDSNRGMLAAQVHSVGGQPRMLPVAPDRKDSMLEAVQDALDDEIVLLTGGSSVGKYDFSREVVESTGAELHFDRIAIKPGKPVLYFTRGERQIFCLPGNPVSAFVTFELLVRPVIERRSGATGGWPEPLQLEFAGSLRAPPGRDLLQISRLIGADHTWRVEPIRWHGSGDLVSMARADALVHLPAGESRDPGDRVSVLLLGNANLPVRERP